MTQTESDQTVLWRIRPLAIPRTLDDITPEWLTGALRANANLNDPVVESLSVKPTGNGYAGVLGRLTVIYADECDTPSTLIAKLPSVDPDIRKYAIDDGMYRRETRFYQDLAKDSGIPVPKCYYADLDSKTGGFVLLLEDLGDMREGDEVAGCSVEDAMNVVRNLAQLHAAWWNDGRTASLDWLAGTESPSMTGMRLQNLYVEAWDKTSHTFARIYPPDTFNIAERLGPNLAVVLQAATTGHQTLNHGDTHLGNMFFRDPEVVLVDWQNVMVTSPALDIAYFIQGSLQIETRRTHEQELLDEYLTTLYRNGVTGYSRDQLIDDYRRGVLRTLVPSVLSMANLDMETPDSRELIETIGARMIGIADWDCGALIPGS